MIKFIFTVYLLLTLCSISEAAVLILSSNGIYTATTTLAAAATDANASGKTILVTSPQAVTTAIVWPSDRVLRFERGAYVLFSGAGSLTGLRETSPDWFGRNTTPGTTSMVTATQKAFDSLDTKNGGIMRFDPGQTYYLPSAVNLPKGSGAVFEIMGTGTTLYTDQGNTMLQLVPTDNNQANVIISSRFLIRGLTFKGTKVANQIGLNLGATYGSVIEDCHFLSLDTGCILKFCLKAIVRNCFATTCVTNSFIAQNGDWSGADLNNSQSNVTVFDSVRVYNNTGAFSSFKVLASNEITLRNCIIEGGNPQYGVYFDTLYSTTVKQIDIDGCHVECTPSVVSIKLKGTGGLAVIRKIFQQYVSLIVDTSDFYGNPMSVQMYDTTYIAGTPAFKDAYPGLWQFYGNNASLISNHTLNTSYWVDGKINGAAMVYGDNAGGGPDPGIYSSGTLHIATKGRTTIGSEHETALYGGNTKLNVNENGIYTVGIIQTGTSYITGEGDFIRNGAVVRTTGGGNIEATGTGRVTTENGLQEKSTAVFPACNVGTRGLFYAQKGATGVKDAVSVCAKDAGDSYAWRAIY